MSQNKTIILCTRTIDEALIKDAGSKNILIDVMPFIKTEPVSSIEIQRKIKQTLLLPATVVFTSMNAVEAVASELYGQKPDWKIFCIGHATRQLAEKYFGIDLISEIADDAKNLADIIINKTKADEVIFFCGDQRRDELPHALRKNNIDVTEIVVYKTVLIPHKIEKKYNGILFFSPSAVQSFFQNNQVDSQTILFVIGATTANEVKKYLPADKAGSTNKIIVSDEPEKKSLLEKVITFFQINPIHH